MTGGETGEDVKLDLRGQATAAQMATLLEQYRSLRGHGATVRALVEDQPVRLYMSLLESGFRVVLESDDSGAVLQFRPDGSTPRSRAGAHSLVMHSAGRVYVNTADDRVAVLDAGSRKVLRHVGVGNAPQHLELSPDHERLYVANAGSNNVSVVDTASDTVSATSPTGARPLLPCATSEGTVFLSSGPEATVTALDREGQVLATLPVGIAPGAISVSPDGQWAYQPNSVTHNVTVIDARRRTVVGEVQVGLGPGHIAFSPDSRWAFVANTVSDTISVVDVHNHELAGTIPAGTAAHLPLLSHDGRRGYVADFGSDDLAVWDTASHEPLGRIAVGIYPHAFAISPDDRWIVVSNTGESSVSIVDARQRRSVARLEVGAGPSHVVFDPSGDCAFVACQLSNQVAVVEPARQRLLDLIDVATPAA